MGADAVLRRVHGDDAGAERDVHGGERHRAGYDSGRSDGTVEWGAGGDECGGGVHGIRVHDGASRRGELVLVLSRAVGDVRADYVLLRHGRVFARWCSIVR